MRSGPFAVVPRAVPPRLPAPAPHRVHSPPHLPLFDEWRSLNHAPVHARAEDVDGCPESFSGQSFALGLLAGLLIATVAFASWWWYRRTTRKRKDLRIDAYAANRDHLASRFSQAPTEHHHIITEAAIGSPPVNGNPMSTYHGSTTGLISAASTPGFATAMHGRSTSIRSTATTATQATHTTATRGHPLSMRRFSRSDMSLPLPIAQRDARGKFSSLEEPPFPREAQHEPMPVLPILRDGHQSMAPTRASVWSTGTGGVTTDGFRQDRHISLAYTAQPSTATGEWFPRSPDAPFLFKLPQATQSLESLARTAVARESVSSMVSTRSSRTRVPPPTIPAPTSPLPTPPIPSRSLSTADEEKRLLALQNALHTQLPPSPASPLMSAGSEASPLLPDGHRRSASGRPLPDAPSGPNSASSMSARDEKAFLSQPWTAPNYPSVPRRPDSPGARSVAESSRHGRRDTMPPAYSRPPSRFE